MLRDAMAELHSYRKNTERPMRQLLAAHLFILDSFIHHSSSVVYRNLDSSKFILGTPTPPILPLPVSCPSHVVKPSSQQHTPTHLHTRPTLRLPPARHPSVSAHRAGPGLPAQDGSGRERGLEVGCAGLSRGFADGSAGKTMV